MAKKKVVPLAVRSKVREVAKGMRVSGDFFDALDEKIAEIIKEAVKRAKGNGRATLRAYDL